MIDEQTERSVETMCNCGIDFEELKRCYPQIDESILKNIYEKRRGLFMEEQS